jgi:hypothetical protein
MAPPNEAGSVKSEVGSEIGSQQVVASFHGAYMAPTWRHRTYQWSFHGVIPWRLNGATARISGHSMASFHGAP